MTALGELLLVAALVAVVVERREEMSGRLGAFGSIGRAVGFWKQRERILASDAWPEEHLRYRTWTDTR